MSRGIGLRGTRDEAARKAPSGRATLLSTAALIALLASPAFAQDAGGEAPVPAAAEAEEEEQEAALLPDVVVTASPLASPLGELAAPVDVVTRDEIVTSSARTLGDLLGDLPGISQSSFAAGASRPIIRGLDNTRVRMQENGIGAADVWAVSEDHGVPLDPLAAERVEVVRGPATLRYGSEAIGGVVNVINNRIPKAIPAGGFDAEAGASYDTVSDGVQG